MRLLVATGRTNGRVEVQIFPNNQLGNEKEMIEGLLLGTLDITVPSNGVVTNPRTSSASRAD